MAPGRVAKTGSIQTWLDTLKEGYAERFAGAFEELGVEDVSDLQELTSRKGDAALKQVLEARGAKTIQVQKIRRAIGEAGEAGAQPQLPRANWHSPDPHTSPDPNTWPAEFPTYFVPVYSSANTPAKADIPGLMVLQHGDGPRMYMVPGIDGDISGVGFAYRALAPLLTPCHSCALAFDREAASCDSIPSLALLYNQRIMADAVRYPESPIFIAGYSLGCVVAHQMALQFQSNFTEVGLILFGFEVTWPPAPSWQRVGGYDWLGGDIEAPLLVARSIVDGREWAAREAQALLRLPSEQRDASDVQSRVFSEVVAKSRNSRWADFQSYVAKASSNLEALHAMTRGTFSPPGTFNGPTLLELAPDSPESHVPARFVNVKFCSSMSVVYAAGNHFNMLQRDQAPTAAKAVLRFVQKLGHILPATLAPFEAEAW